MKVRRGRMKARPCRRATAYHEAGHAVVARLRGVEVVEVDMVANKAYLGNVQINSASEKAQQAGGDQAAIARALYSDLMVAHAGVAAERRAGYQDCCGSKPDSDNMIWYACALARVEAGLPMPGPDEPLKFDRDEFNRGGSAVQGIFNRMADETDAMLRDNWPAVVRVAKVLAKRDRLTQAELDHVIAGSAK